MTEDIPVLSCAVATNLLRRIATRSLVHRMKLAMIVVGAFLGALFTPAGIASAQEVPLHLNPAIEKLAHGQPIIGTQTDDMSLQNCHSLARLNFDYTYVDMEHGPLNLDGLAYCVAAMVDKAAI